MIHFSLSATTTLPCLKQLLQAARRQFNHTIHKIINANPCVHGLSEWLGVLTSIGSHTGIWSLQTRYHASPYAWLVLILRLVRGILFVFCAVSRVKRVRLELEVVMFWLGRRTKNSILQRWTKEPILVNPTFSFTLFLCKRTRWHVRILRTYLI